MDCIIPASYKDLNKVKISIQNLIKHCKDVDDIYVITPNPDDFSPHEIHDHKVKVFSDFEVVPWMKPLMNLIRFRPGWLLQQFLKLFQNITRSDLYYVLDADCIPVNDFQLLKDGKPVLWSKPNCRDESAFLRMISRISGGELADWNTNEYGQTWYIADMAVFSKNLIQEFVDRYFHGSKEEACFQIVSSTYWNHSRTTSLLFSEYEIMGRYVKKFHLADFVQTRCDMLQIDKNQMTQNKWSFTEDEIAELCLKAHSEGKTFCKLQQNCPVDDQKWKELKR